MNESQLFADALKRATQAERTAYLDEACAGNPRLRAEVEALLRTHAKDPDFLEQPAGVLRGMVDVPPATYALNTPPVGTSGTGQTGVVLAGRYQLLEVIGEGGMGAVWMARQTEPVQRSVAVKLIKAGMDSQQVLARFEAERQTLALMDHPNIAKVHDAGTTPEGRPFFVMELVKGVPITQYCDEHHLTPRQRLELFIPVCQALQHAHQKGIIHRDIKPSNVLVAQYDDRPVPKVIDFGVAKATGQQLTEQTLHTGFGAVVGTVEYMSPEQAGFNQLDVDTRSDIYSLGVLLYELLAGSPPFSRKELEKAGMLEMLRVIREQEPSKPSIKLSTADGLPTLAANRGTEPKRLAALVRGEVDWIVMKTLEKDRNRRYATANGLAQDIERYLQDEPVKACPPSRWYRLRKFVRRNKTALATTALLGVMLVVAVTTLAVSYVQVDQALAVRTEALGERTVALREKTVALDAKSSALAAENKARHDLGVALNAEKQARARTREALAEMSTHVIEDWLSRQPDNSPEHRTFLEKAAKFYEEFAAATGDDESALAGVADAHLRLAAIFHQLGRYRDSVRTGQRAATLFRELLDQHPAHRPYRTGLMYALRHQARGLHGLQKHEEADPVQLEAVRLAEQLVAEAPTDLVAVGNLAALLTSRGVQLMNGKQRTKERAADALAGLDRALPLQERLIAASPGNDRYLEGLANLRNTRLVCLLTLGRGKEADRERAAALELFEAIARRSPSYLNARVSAGRMRLNRGLSFTNRSQTAEALAEFRKAESWCGPLANEYPGVPNYRAHLATVYACWARTLTTAGDWSAATELANRALSTFTALDEEFAKTGAEDYKPAAASALTVLADCRAETGQLADAERDYTTAIQWINDRVARVGHGPWTQNDLSAAHAGRARARNRLGRFAEAIADWDKAMEYATADKSTVPHNLQVGKGDTLIRAGRSNEAEPILRACLALREKKEPDEWTTFQTRSLLGAALVGQKKYAEAEPLLLQGHDGLKQRAAKIPPRLRQDRLTETLERVVQLYDAWEKKDQAAVWRKKLIAHNQALKKPTEPKDK